VRLLCRGALRPVHNVGMRAVSVRRGSSDVTVAPDVRDTILLIGIIKKNGIMLIDFALHAERERGLSPEQAIHEACLPRFRPILMTTLCALLGGLLLSQALTLFTTPVVYLYMGKLTHWHGRRSTSSRRSQGSSAAPPGRTVSRASRMRRPGNFTGCGGP